MVKRGTGPRSLMEGSKGGQEPDGGLAVYVSCSLKVDLPPLAGCPAPPFIDQGGRGLHGGGRIKNQRPRRSSESARSSSSSGSALPLTQLDGVRGGAFAGYACVDDVMPCKWSRPIPPLRAACRTGVSAYDTVGGERCGARTPVTTGT